MSLRLLLLPGMDGTGLLFAPLLRALPASLSPQVVSYPLDEPLGYAELAPLVKAAAAEGGDFVVVGESFSGPLALMLAAGHFPGLRGVILCATFARSPLPAPTLWRWIVRPWMFRHQSFWLISHLLLGRRRQDELSRLLREAIRSVSGEAMAARARAVADVDVLEELRTCPVPLLDIRASEDRVVRSHCARLLQRERADMQIVELKGPHLILQSVPSQAAAILAAFCEQVAATNQQLPSNESSK